MQHHNNIGTSGERRCIAGFLVAAVSPVAIVTDRRDAQASRHLDRGVLASIVRQDDVVDDVVRNFVEGPLERLGGVVCRQDYRNLFVRERPTPAFLVYMLPPLPRCSSWVSSSCARGSDRPDILRSGQGSVARSLGSARRRGPKASSRVMAVGCRFPVISRLRAIFPDSGSRKFPVSGTRGARLRLF